MSTGDRIFVKKLGVQCPVMTDSSRTSTTALNKVYKKWSFHKFKIGKLMFLNTKEGTRTSVRVNGNLSI